MGSWGGWKEGHLDSGITNPDRGGIYKDGRSEWDTNDTTVGWGRHSDRGVKSLEGHGC